MRELELRHFERGEECYEIVKGMAEEYWLSRRSSPAYQNYRFDTADPWALGQMLRDGAFDLGCTVLFRAGQPMAFGGLRSHGPDYTLCMGRFFCVSSTQPYGNALILPHHVALSKAAGFKGTCFTINKYNEHILRYYERALPSRSGPLARQAYENFRRFRYVGEKEINHVVQHAFEQHFADSGPP